MKQYLRDKHEPPRVFQAKFKEYPDRILLTDIIYFRDGELFRDHNWLQKSKTISKLLKYVNKGETIMVSFSAIVSTYKDRHGEIKNTLRHIRNLSEITKMKEIK